MSEESVFIFSPEQLKYKFSPNHPFNQARLKLTLDLLVKSNAIEKKQIVPPRAAAREELLLLHDSQYVDAVHMAGHGKLPDELAESYGLATEDVPIFPNMHEASSLLVGGSLTAVDYVMSGRAKHALNLGGGLHHGFRGKASGFCIYNDSAIAIDIFRKSIRMQKFFILIQMLTMGTECNGLFMMIVMCVPYRFMKQDVIYFRVREILMNGVKAKDMVFLLIFLLMPLLKTNPGSMLPCCHHRNCGLF